MLVSWHECLMGKARVTQSEGLKMEEFVAPKIETYDEQEFESDPVQADCSCDWYEQV